MNSERTYLGLLNEFKRLEQRVDQFLEDAGREQVLHQQAISRLEAEIIHRQVAIDAIGERGTRLKELLKALRERL